MTESDELMQELRSKASVLLLREEFNESVKVYSQLISLCQDQLNNDDNKTHQSPDPKLKKSLCLALSNRAEARSRLREFSDALRDCDRALEIETTHFKSLLCKAKILMALHRYSAAADCLRAAQLDPQNSDAISAPLERCKRMESLSRTGSFDISDWISGEFRGKPPELAEFVGPVQVRRSEISGRGLFATKSVETGTLLFVTKAIAVQRRVSGGESLQSEFMWKDFVDEVTDTSSKSPTVSALINSLSSGENEEDLEVPDMSLFGVGGGGGELAAAPADKSKVLSALDVNSIAEASASSQVLGPNRGYYGIGLWGLASFVNHSCEPNARRLHVGDYAVVHASRDIRAGEEVAFAYFDVLCPLRERREMSGSWGFVCGCRRCRFEEEEEEEEGAAAADMGVERWAAARGSRRERGYRRASFWGEFCEAYGGSRWRRSGKGLPPAEEVVESVAEAVGSEERVVRMWLLLLKEKKKKSGAGGCVDIEKAFKFGRGLYGKLMKRQALNILLDRLLS